MKFLTVRPSDGVSEMWAGVALSSPFLADLLGWKVAALLFLPWLIASASRRPKLSFPVPVIALVGLLLVHALALATTSTPFSAVLIRDAVIASFLIAVAISVDGAFYKQCAKGFFYSVVTVASASACLGLLKLGLQDRGYLLGFIVNSCPGQYPQGSNLCTDYNLMGMLWLVGLSGAAASRVKKKNLAPLLLMVLIMAAGLTVGSRRFLVLLPAFIIGWLWMCIAADGMKALPKEVAAVLAVGALSWLAIAIVADPENFERFRFGKEPFTVIGGGSGGSAPNRAYPEVIGQTIFSDGLGSRLDRWKLGLELFASRPWTGYGFAYHEIFSDRFVGGRFIDHPHMPLLSYSLIGGAGLFFVVLLLYAGLGIGAIRSPQEVVVTGIPVAFILATGIAFISGDNLFSIPQWLAIGLAFIVAANGWKKPDAINLKNQTEGHADVRGLSA
ncbi:hypothetical protein [Nostoc phage Nsp-JY10]